MCILGRMARVMAGRIALSIVWRRPVYGLCMVGRMACVWWGVWPVAAEVYTQY